MERVCLCCFSMEKGMMMWMGYCGSIQSCQTTSLCLFLLIRLFGKISRIFGRNADIMIRVARTSNDPPNRTLKGSGQMRWIVEWKYDTKCN